MTKSPIVIAHRGASTQHPENTLMAFEAAVSCGADGIELDVRRSADAALVVNHDPMLDDGRLIVEHTAQELPKSRPLLAEALAVCSDLMVNVEIKNLPHEPDFDPALGIAKAVVEELGMHQESNYVVSSFHRETIDRVHELAPNLPTALLHVAFDISVAVKEAVAHGHVGIHPFVGWINESGLKEAHDAGLFVNVWTVDDADQIRRLAELGVDGIVTNRPDVARAALDRG